MRTKGRALPWIDEIAFLRHVIAQARSDYEAARQRQGAWVFFDRGLVDAAIVLQHLTGEPILSTVGAGLRYHRSVFIAPPWPEIYRTDNERRHGIDAGIAEYERLINAYPALGYDLVMLPKAGVAERAEFILQTLGL